jgi:hypothetical protein
MCRCPDAESRTNLSGLGYGPLGARLQTLPLRRALPTGCTRRARPSRRCPPVQRSAPHARGGPSGSRPAAFAPHRSRPVHRTGDPRHSCRVAAIPHRPAGRSARPCWAAGYRSRCRDAARGGIAHHPDFGRSHSVRQAGLPEGVVGVVTNPRETSGDVVGALIDHPAVKLIKVKSIESWDATERQVVRAWRQIRRPANSPPRTRPHDRAQSDRRWQGPSRRCHRSGATVRHARKDR